MFRSAEGRAGVIEDGVGGAGPPSGDGVVQRGHLDDVDGGIARLGQGGLGRQQRRQRFLVAEEGRGEGVVLGAPLLQQRHHRRAPPQPRHAERGHEDDALEGVARHADRQRVGLVRVDALVEQPADRLAPSGGRRGVQEISRVQRALEQGGDPCHQGPQPR